jgi:hypothetical protein
MTISVDPEVLQTAAFAILLGAAAAALDLFAHRTPRHVIVQKIVGFRYRRELNAWQCSEGYFLWLREVDHAAHIARYRANAQICNRCAAKRFCTESNDGRELIQPLKHSPPAEEGQFWRGLSLLLLAVAASVPLVESFRHHTDPELLLLMATFAVIVAISRVTLRNFLKWGRYTEQPER